MGYCHLRQATKRRPTEQITHLLTVRCFCFLPSVKIGTLINTLCLLHGDTHELGGYFASMDGVLKVLVNEIVWDIEPKTEEAETSKVVIN